MEERNRKEDEGRMIGEGMRKGRKEGDKCRREGRKEWKKESRR